MALTGEVLPLNGVFPMKCPSCNTQVNEGAGVCQKCGQKLDKGSPKRTMMGLPSISDDGDSQDGDEPTTERDRSTLFGIPAVGDQEAGDREAGNQEQDEPEDGLAESTEPAQGNTARAAREETDSTADASTQVVSERDLGQALGEAVDEATSGGRKKHQTAFGLPSPKENDDITQEDDALDEAKAFQDPSEDDDVASAWGLAEQSSEEIHSETQVAGASLADAILESKQGATGFSKSTGDSDPIRGTLMGMSRDEIADQESTREVSREQLNAVRDAAVRDAAAKGAAARGEQAKTPSPPEPESPFEEDDDATQTLGADELAEFEDRIQTDRRKQLLNKLRPKGTSKKPNEPNKPNKPSDSATPGASSSGQQSKPPPLGPRFSIPKPGQNSQGQTTADEPPELSVEPIEELTEEIAEEATSEFGSGQTSFPISAENKPDQTDDGVRELSDDELEIALGDTGVVSADETGERVNPADVNVSALEAGEGIQPFDHGNDDVGESTFPIDDLDDQAASSSEVDLNADFKPPSQDQPEPAHAPQRSEVNFGATPASGTNVPPQQRPDQAQSPASQSPPPQGQQQFQQQQPAQQPPQFDQQPDPSASLIKTVQVIFGILGALFLIGAGAYGYFSHPSDDLVQQAIMGLPALVGLLTLLVSVVPLSSGLQSGGFAVMGALAIGALSAAVVFSAASGTLLLALGGLLLVLCAAVFPLVLKVVQ
jgi:hypothetical protein